MQSGFNGMNVDFNPRSRVGNDKIFVFHNMKVVISIHVPAWGTTTVVLCAAVDHCISIHVPAWGTTKTRSQKIKDKEDFNPRSRVGNDANLEDFRIPQ